MDLVDGLTVGVSECERSGRICVQFLIDAEHRLALKNPVLLILNQSGQELGIAGPENFPVGIPVGPIEFEGGLDRPRSGFEKQLSKTMGWNRYHMTFQVPRTVTGDPYVELPRLLLDGRVIATPRFRFRQAIEEHCTTMSFMV